MLYSSLNPNINVGAGEGEEIIQLGPDRIAVVNNNISSAMGGTILLFRL